jgi:prepilin signal peptidase PulO-like enzyme (type II secretory pathway)
MLVTNHLIKKQSMGYGDIILIGIIGIWLGLFKGLAVIFFGSVFSLIHWLFLSKKQNSQVMIPFGFSLSICAIATYIIYQVYFTY